MYRALRNVCIGVDRHVSPASAPFELDSSTAQFLSGIGAIAKVEEPSEAPAAAAAPASAELQPEAPALAPEPDKPTKDAKASKKGT